MQLLLVILILCNLYNICTLSISDELVWFEQFLLCPVSNPIARFYLVTPNGDVELTDRSNLNTNYNHTTYFYIHGWLSNSSSFGNLGNALYKECKCNVIKVDFAPMAAQPYFCVPQVVKYVGPFVGKFIADTYKSKQIDVKNTRVVGHSLGSHIGGIAGTEVYKAVNEPLARVTGLDPAGPLFTSNFKLLPGFTLSKAAAKFVDVLHTTIFFGAIEPIGHVDTYAIGVGDISLQYPCVVNQTDLLLAAICSHVISIYYYKYSIPSCVIRVQQYKGILTNIPYGYHMPDYLRGTFTFNPESHPPYGNGDPNCYGYD